MKFEFEVPKSTVTVQESVPLSFRLHNDGPDTEVPFEYDSTDVLTLSLLDADGKVICRADGYDRMERHGVWAPRVPQSELDTGTLPADGTMVWEEDLLLYMEVQEPGSYSLLAEFKFQPSGIDLQSQSIALEVTPNDPGWIDVVDDYVSIGMTYALQRTQSDGDHVGLMRLASSSRPVTFWKGGVVPLPPDAEPRISEADFVTRETFDHDLFRWIIWITAGNLQAIQFSDKAPVGPAREYHLGDGNWKLVGRPIQHFELGVSVLVMDQLDDRAEVRCLNFSDHFELLDSIELPSLAAHPYPIATAADWSGSRYIAFAEAGKFPVHLVEFVKEGEARRVARIGNMQVPVIQREIDAGNTVRVLALRISAKGLIPGSKAFLITAVSEGEHGITVLLCRMPLEAHIRVGETIQVDEIMLPEQILDADERLAGGAIAETGQSGLHAVLITSQGRLLHVTKGVDPQLIQETGEARIAVPGPFLTTSEDIHLFFGPGDGRGIFHRTI